MGGKIVLVVLAGCFLFDLCSPLRPSGSILLGKGQDGFGSQAGDILRTDWIRDEDEDEDCMWLFPP